MLPPLSLHARALALAEAERIGEHEGGLVVIAPDRTLSVDGVGAGGNAGSVVHAALRLHELRAVPTTLAGGCLDLGTAGGVALGEGAGVELMSGAVGAVLPALLLLRVARHARNDEGIRDDDRGLFGPAIAAGGEAAKKALRIGHWNGSYFCVGNMGRVAREGRLGLWGTGKGQYLWHFPGLQSVPEPRIVA